VAKKEIKNHDPWESRENLDVEDGNLST